MTRAQKEKRDQRIERAARLVDRDRFLIKASLIASVDDFVFLLPDCRLVEALKAAGVVVPREVATLSPATPTSAATKPKTKKIADQKMCAVAGCGSPTKNPAYTKCEECHKGIPPNLRAPRPAPTPAAHTRICILRKPVKRQRE